MNANFKDKLSEISSKLTAVKQTTDKRIYLICEAENCHIINRFLFEQLGMRFAIATAIDCSNHFEILYHFSNDSTGQVVTTKAFIRDYEHPSIESTAQFLPGASWIEREIHDEFGIEFRNHPNMKRLILADDWPTGVYPLRKKSSK